MGFPCKIGKRLADQGGSIAVLRLATVIPTDEKPVSQAPAYTSPTDRPFSGTISSGWGRPMSEGSTTYAESNLDKNGFIFRCHEGHSYETHDHSSFVCTHVHPFLRERFAVGVSRKGAKDREEHEEPLTVLTGAVFYYHVSGFVVFLVIIRSSVVPAAHHSFRETHRIARWRFLAVHRDLPVFADVRLEDAS